MGGVPLTHKGKIPEVTEGWYNLITKCDVFDKADLCHELQICAIKMKQHHEL